MIISLRIKGNHLRDDVFTLVTLFLSILRSSGLVWDGVVKKRDYLIGLYPSKTCKSRTTATITGSRDLLTAANYSSTSRRRVMVILVAIAVVISAIIAAVFFGNTFRNTQVMITGKVSIRCHSSFAIYSKVNDKRQLIWTKDRSWSKFQHIDVSLSMSLIVESNHLIFT